VGTENWRPPKAGGGGSGALINRFCNRNRIKNCHNFRHKLFHTFGRPEGHPGETLRQFAGTVLGAFHHFGGKVTLRACDHSFQEGRLPRPDLLAARFGIWNRLRCQKSAWRSLASRRLPWRFPRLPPFAEGCKGTRLTMRALRRARLGDTSDLFQPDNAADSA